MGSMSIIEKLLMTHSKEPEDTVPPFALIDLGMTCVIGNPELFRWRHNQLKAWLAIAFSEEMGNSLPTGNSLKYTFTGSLAARVSNKSDSSKGNILALTDGPAQKAGVKAGWSITSINGKDFTYDRLQDAIASGKEYDLSFASEVDFDALLTPEQLCSTFLQLPLMWTSIGWDWRGLMWEDTEVRGVGSFYGMHTYVSKSFRHGETQYCEGNATTTNVGDSSHARLVLRAILPTYYRHVYVESKVEVIQYGAWLIESGSAEFTLTRDWDPFKNHMASICTAATASYSALDGLLSQSNLREGHLLSQAALDRDSDTCTLTSQYCQYSKCDACSRESPCFNPTENKCHEAESAGRCPPSSTLQYAGKQCSLQQANAVAKSCQCHKAICWFFSSDFAATLQAFAKAETCAKLL